MNLLIDGDIIAYRCGFAGEKMWYDVYHAGDLHYTHEEGEEGIIVPVGIEPVESFSTAKACKAWFQLREKPDAFVRLSRKEVDPVANVLHSVKVVMQRIFSQMNTARHTMYFSCPTKENWRTGVYPEYKTRPPRRPVHYAEVRRYMEENYQCLNQQEWEADDLIAIEAATHEDLGTDWCIVSIDKDFLQIPGKHFNWVKEELVQVTPVEAMQNLAVQRIMGDSVDTIPGVPGMGEAYAKAWLQEPRDSRETLDDIVLSAYRNHYNAKDGYSDVDAYYHCVVNSNMVTLASSWDDRERLEWEILNARAYRETAEKELPNDSEGTGSAAENAEDAT